MDHPTLAGRRSVDPGRSYRVRDTFKLVPIIEKLQVRTSAADDWNSLRRPHGRGRSGGVAGSDEPEPDEPSHRRKDDRSDGSPKL
ncbi:hypothetical protein GCM10027176_72040 [Actinoallomurus bryophytorum]